MLGKILKWGVIIIVLIFILSIFFGGEKKPEPKPVCGDGTCDAGETVASCPKDCKEAEPGEEPKEVGTIQSWKWYKVVQNDIAELAPGWSKPILLEISQLGWFESLHVSPDGKTIYMFHYPGVKDFLTLRLQNGPFNDDGDIHYSEWPFKTHKKLNKYYLSEDVVTSSGVSVDREGNFFYATIRDGLPDGAHPGNFKKNIYRNDIRLAFNKEDDDPDNPFYCEARDELWFDCNMDSEICVLKNAKASGFDGIPQKAPYPINSKDSKKYAETGLAEGTDAQPFLTEDCQTIYWTSNRGRIGEGPWIYISHRLGEDKWSEPEVVVKGKVAVGEPSLTADGSKLFFVQFVMNDKINPKTGVGEFRTVLYFTEREKTISSV